MELSTKHNVGIEVIFGGKIMKLKAIKNGKAILEDESEVPVEELNVLDGHARLTALLELESSKED